MKSYTYKIVLLCVFAIIKLSQTCPQAQYWKFYVKLINKDYEIIQNPYINQSKQYIDKVEQNLHNKVRVCGIKYLSQTKQLYELKTFQSKQQALKAQFIITHQGICGKCSTTKDLYVYLTTDLTRPVRHCGLKHFLSHRHLKSCILSLGFTPACAQVWYYNTINTKKHCLKECLYATLVNQPFIKNGKLNKCLQCDQDISGPVFKYESGRTRRNSGIKSQIDRPEDQVYKMDQCYY